ncbi:MAG: type II toxin-antitoxin system RelE/ParE family toxin [Luteolibacter sp.]
MEFYRVEFAIGVEKDLRKIPAKQAARIIRATEKLAANPNPPGSVKLVGHDAKFRIRVGDYRVIYEIHNSVLVVLVIEIGHRKDIYR